MGELPDRCTLNLLTVRTLRAALSLWVAPLLQSPLHLVADQKSGFCPIHPRHEQLVVAGVAMANRRGDGESERSGVEGPAGGAAAHSATATRARVMNDLFGTIAGFD